MSYLVDTNILLRSIDSNHPMYNLATSAVINLLTQDEKLYIMPQNLIEFWNVYTRPIDKNGLGGTIEDVKTEIERLKNIFILLQENEEIYIQWEKLVINYQVKGVNVHDAKLVAGMLVYGLTSILTFNISDFKRYQGIKSIHPQELC